MKGYPGIDTDVMTYSEERVNEAKESSDEPVATLLTTLAVGAFFAPFAFLGDLPGHEIVNPMGSVIIGGLVTSAIVTLFLLPALYLRFGQGQAQIEELDLRDLWEVDLTEERVEAGVR